MNTFTLPQLNYNLTDLAPVISEETMKVHYEKHHKGYVQKLNKLLLGSPFESSSLEEIIKKSKNFTNHREIPKNAGQAWNHTFYFMGLTPKKKGLKNSRLSQAIQNQFGSVEELQRRFNERAVRLFGSGWAWLVRLANGKLGIKLSTNAGNPMRQGMTPLLACDLWEHAYYLDYRNLRANYLDAFWNLVDWDFVTANFERNGFPDMTALMLDQESRPCAMKVNEGFQHLTWFNPVLDGERQKESA